MTEAPEAGGRPGRPDLEHFLTPSLRRQVTDDLEIQVVSERFGSTIADVCDHLFEFIPERVLGSIVETLPDLVGGAVCQIHFLRTALHVDGLQVKIQKIGDAARELIDGNEFLVGPDVESLPVEVGLERELLENTDVVLDE